MSPVSLRIATCAIPSGAFFSGRLASLGDQSSCPRAGLALAIALNSRDVPLRLLFPSILIIPYAVPGWLIVTTWRGLLNPVYGPCEFGHRGV